MTDSISNQIMNKGMSTLSSLEDKIADAINSTEEMSQTDLIQLQQLTSTYTNTISMMTNILKDLSDADAEIIRNT